MVVELQRPVLVRQVRAPEPAQHRLGRPFQLIEPDERVDLGDLCGELRSVPLSHAPGHHQPAQASFPPAPGDLQDCAYRFPLGVLDEATGVDYHDLGGVQIGRDLGAALHKVSEHDLAIHQVLGTAEPDHPYFYCGGSRASRSVAGGSAACPPPARRRSAPRTPTARVE